jgi:hypothetical protein
MHAFSAKGVNGSITGAEAAAMLGARWNCTFITRPQTDLLASDDAIAGTFHYNAVFPKIMRVLRDFGTILALPENDLSVSSAIKHNALHGRVGYVRNSIGWLHDKFWKFLHELSSFPVNRDAEDQATL